MATQSEMAKEKYLLEIELPEGISDIDLADIEQGIKQYLNDHFEGDLLEVLKPQ